MIFTAADQLLSADLVGKLLNPLAQSKPSRAPILGFYTIERERFTSGGTWQWAILNY